MEAEDRDDHATKKFWQTTKPPNYLKNPFTGQHLPRVSAAQRQQVAKREGC
jgi:hypothetical protein